MSATLVGGAAVADILEYAAVFGAGNRRRVDEDEARTLDLEVLADPIPEIGVERVDAGVHHADADALAHQDVAGGVLVGAAGDGLLRDADLGGPGLGIVEVAHRAVLLDVVDGGLQHRRAECRDRAGNVDGVGVATEIRDDGEAKRRDDRVLLRECLALGEMQERAIRAAGLQCIELPGQRRLDVGDVAVRRGRVSDDLREHLRSRDGARQGEQQSECQAGTEL